MTYRSTLRRGGLSIVLQFSVWNPWFFAYLFKRKIRIVRVLRRTDNTTYPYIRVLASLRIMLLVSVDQQCISVDCWRLEAFTPCTTQYMRYNVGNYYYPSRVLLNFSWLCTNFTTGSSNKLEINPWAPAGFFPGVGKLGVSGHKHPSEVQGWIPGGGLGRSTEKPTTGCENNAQIIRLLGVLLYLLMHKNTLQHFQRGGGQVPPCPCLRAPI